MAVAASSPAFPIAASCCRLTTFAWNGEAIETFARFGLVGGRAYVGIADTSPTVERIWNSSSARFVPCTPDGRPAGAAVHGEARVLSPSEEAAARGALAGSEWPRRSHLDDVIYVEIVPGNTSDAHRRARSSG